MRGFKQIHCKAIFNILNRQHNKCTFSLITIKWSESETICRKLGVSTQLQICKDSYRCQSHYLHGYRILQHQVQITFLEAPLASLSFTWMHWLWLRKPWVNNNTGEMAAAVASVLPRLAFFKIICCWPATKLHCSASFWIVICRVFTRAVTLNV